MADPKRNDPASGAARPRRDQPASSGHRLPRGTPRQPDTTKPGAETRGQGDTRGDTRGGSGAGTESLVGRTLGPCQLIELIGEGGLGRVYRARHLRLNHDVAVKVIGSRTKPEALARFRKEAQIAARLNHPHVARVLDADEQDGIHFIIQELVPGESLEDRVVKRGALALDEACRVGAGMASGLDSIHKAGIVHRDLKPANVIIAPDGQPKLLDFGIAKDLGEEAGFTDEKAMLGTPTFLAPEQVTGNARVGPAADLYGLGGTLYYALTARAPLEPHEDDTLLRYLNRRTKEEPTPLESLRGDLPSELTALVKQLLSIDPGDRPTAKAVHDALQAIERAQPRRSGSTPAPARAPKAGTPGAGVGRGPPSERLATPGAGVGRGPPPTKASGKLDKTAGTSGRFQLSATPGGEGPRRGASERLPSQGAAVSTGMPTPSSPSSKPGGIQGSLEEMPLTELLQGVEFNQKTGHVEIESASVKGVIEFQTGNPWDARTADGRQGEEAMRVLLRQKAGSFRLRSEEPRNGTRRVKVSFTRLLLDASRVDDESGRHPKVEEAPKPSPPPPPPRPEEPDPDDSSSALEGVKRLYSSQEVQGALDALEADAVEDVVGDPFIGCAIGSFEVQRFVSVEDGERRYLAWDEQSESRGLLRIFPLFGPHQTEFERLAKRAELVVGIAHQNLQPCLGSGRTRDAFFAAFEPPMGVALTQLIAQGPQSVERTLSIVEDVARALKALHRRDQVHGCLSPATVRLTPNEAVVVTDAGLGRPHPAFDFLGEGGEVLGPPGFVAPETLDQGQRGPAADIYALGCVAWSLLNGRSPAGGEDEDPHVMLERVHSGVPPVKGAPGAKLPDGVVTLVRKMTANDLRERHKSINDVLADVRAAQEGKPVQPFPSVAGAGRARAGFFRRHPAALGTALVAVCAALLLAIAGVLAAAGRVELREQPFGNVVLPVPR